MGQKRRRPVEYDKRSGPNKGGPSTSRVGRESEVSVETRHKGSNL